MLIEIKHRFNNNVLFACEAENLKSAVLQAVENRANLRGANLSCADLTCADLSYVDLSYANLTGANLRGANLTGANLSGADLTGVDLTGALRGANLSYANLRGANLSCANLRGANLRGVNLRGANLRGEKIAICPILISGSTWNILISESYLVIGCERHTHDEWKRFSDDEIASMESRALAFWSANKLWLLSACKVHRKESLEFRKANPEIKENV